MVDMVITVLIIGILAAVAAPKFATAYARLQAEATARRIASDLNYARRAARQTSQTAVVTFRTSPAGYDMENVEHPAYPSQSYSVNLSDVESNILLEQVSFDGSNQLRFNSYGRPLVGTTPLLNGFVKVRSGTSAATITIDPSTGEATFP